ncbi:hypothetical protein THAOC_09191, partial [Thalassiosira oceanica]
MTRFTSSGRGGTRCLATESYQYFPSQNVVGLYLPGWIAAELGEGGRDLFTITLNNLKTLLWLCQQSSGAPFALAIPLSASIGGETPSRSSKSRNHSHITRSHQSLDYMNLRTVFDAVLTKGARLIKTLAPKDKSLLIGFRTKIVVDSLPDDVDPILWIHSVKTGERASLTNNIRLMRHAATRAAQALACDCQMFLGKNLNEHHPNSRRFPAPAAEAEQRSLAAGRTRRHPAEQETRTAPTRAGTMVRPNSAQSAEEGAIVRLRERIATECPDRGHAPPLSQKVAFRSLPISEATLRGLEEGDGKPSPGGRGGRGGNQNAAGNDVGGGGRNGKKKRGGVNLSNKKEFWDMTDIQNACIPHALKGRDILGAARTGRRQEVQQRLEKFELPSAAPPGVVTR